jgi:hypothetical protein
VSAPVRVARLRHVRSGRTWTARGGRAGWYTVQVKLRHDMRVLNVQRSAGRFHRRAASRRHPGCGAVRSFALGSPVFGGATRRALRVGARLAPGADGRIELRRGGRTLRHRSVGGRRKWRISAAGLRRGTYRVRVVAHTASGATVRRTLVAHRL